MTALQQLLARVAGVYADLVDASLPGRTGELPDAPRDPRDKPAPGRLDVLDHRHKLVRGLRWWVDAVRDPDQPHPRVGESVPHLCAYLLGQLHVMAPEDRDELRTNLEDWLAEAVGITGERVRPAKVVELPEGAEDAMVRVADAARILGVSVRTIQRRAPRAAGLVRLGDVLGEVRTVTVAVAQ